MPKLNNTSTSLYHYLVFNEVTDEAIQTDYIAEVNRLISKDSHNIAYGLLTVGLAGKVIVE